MCLVSALAVNREIERALECGDHPHTRAQRPRLGPSHQTPRPRLVMIETGEMKGAVDHETRQLAAWTDAIAAGLDGDAIERDDQVAVYRGGASLPAPGRVCRPRALRSQVVAEAQDVGGAVERAIAAVELAQQGIVPEHHADLPRRPPLLCQGRAHERAQRCSDPPDPRRTRDGYRHRGGDAVSVLRGRESVRGTWR